MSMVKVTVWQSFPELRRVRFVGKDGQVWITCPKEDPEAEAFGPTGWARKLEAGVGTLVIGPNKFFDWALLSEEDPLDAAYNKVVDCYVATERGPLESLAAYAEKKALLFPKCRKEEFGPLEQEFFREKEEALALAEREFRQKFGMSIDVATIVIVAHSEKPVIVRTMTMTDEKGEEIPFQEGCACELCNTYRRVWDLRHDLLPHIRKLALDHFKWSNGGWPVRCRCIECEPLNLKYFDGVKPLFDD